MRQAPESTRNALALLSGRQSPLAELWSTRLPDCFPTLRVHLGSPFGEDRYRQSVECRREIQPALNYPHFLAGKYVP